MPEINYYDLSPEFSKIYLEDSYVLDVVENTNNIVFQMEIVLSENHSFYSLPLPEEQYCYKKGEIIFPETKEVKWVAKKMKATIDINGEIDYGNIDSFIYKEGKYFLEGEFGEVIIESKLPLITFNIEVQE